MDSAKKCCSGNIAKDLKKESPMRDEGKTTIGILYTCPMHPEMVRNLLGNCPICGMTLERQMAIPEPEENAELKDLRRRFAVGIALSAPLLLLAMPEFIPVETIRKFLSARWSPFVQFILATPAVLWCGLPFFERGWQSIWNRKLNMFTLVAMGTGTAYGYSVVGTFFPSLFPSSYRSMHHARA
jgi:Cu+-exporting ATPase